MGRHATTRGFTIVELIAVIVIIGILSLLVLNTITGAQRRARDAVRSDDIHAIVGYLISYNTIHDGLPRPATYAENNGGGYDTSNTGDWLPFISAVTNAKAPKDPANTGSGDPTTNTSYVYFYTCFQPGDSGNPSPGNSMARIGYRSENTGQLKTNDLKIDNCQ